MVSVRLSLSRGSLPLCAAGGILLIPLFPLELDGEARTGEREVCRALFGDFFKLPSGSFLRLRCLILSLIPTCDILKKRIALELVLIP